ncbi:MAG: ATP-binding protein, partial [Victivallaceae bacterium]|nr:ATP-binding protein [Victivallaceae bacterium]
SGRIKKIDTVFRSDCSGERKYYNMRLQTRNFSTLGDHLGALECLGMLFDVSSERRKELKYRDQATLLQTVVDRMPCLLFVKNLDDQHRLLLCNDNYRRYFQTNLGSPLGKNDFDLFPRELAEKFYQEDRQILRDGKMLEQVEHVKFPGQEECIIRTVKTLVKQEETGHTLLIGLAQDVTELHLKEEALKEYYSNEKMLNQCIGIVMEHAQESNALELVLAQLGEYLNADRCYIFQYIDERSVVSNVFEWTADGISPQIDNLKAVPQELLRRWTGEFLQHRLVDCADLKHPTEEMNDVLDILIAQSIASLQVCGIWCGGRLWGFLGIDYVRRQRQFNEHTKLTLESLSRFVGLYIELQQYNQSLQEFLQQDELIKQCYSDLFLVQNFKDSFLQIAEMLGTYLHSALVNISDYHSDGRARFESIAHWDRDAAVVPVPYSLIYEDEKPRTFACLKRGEVLHCTRKDFLDGKMQKDWHEEIRDYFFAQKCSEWYCSPIMRNGSLWGYVGTEIHEADVALGESGVRLLTAAMRMLDLLVTREEIHVAVQRMDEERQLMLDILPLPIVLMKPDSTILHYNQAFDTMVDIQMPLTGLHCRSRICQNDCSLETCPVTRTLAEGTAQSFEKQLRKCNYLVKTMPVFENGSIAKIIVAYIDLSEVAQSRLLLQEALTKAKEATRAKSLFLATMSHEIRTPLNSIIGFSELLQDAATPAEEREEYLHSINYAGNALLHLINNILDLSKAEAGQTIITNHPLNLNLLLQEMKAIFQHKLIEANTELTIAAEGLPTLLLDGPHIRQILLNLLGNAVKFTRNGQIRVQAQYFGGTLTIQVQDDGCGISSAILPNIFDPFVQDSGNCTNRGSSAGTGLGLPIVKRLTEAMDGMVTVESQVGKGTCFTIVIPDVAVCQTTKEADVSPERKRSERKNFPILIVDDVPLNLKVLGAMLRKLGYSPVSESSPIQALQRVKEQRPALILTDIWMPEMNGAQLATEIRALPEGARIPIVAVTADNDSGKNFDISLFNDILLKPLTLQKLNLVLDRCFEESAD